MSSDEDDSGGGGKCFFGTALPELKDDDPANLRKKPLAIEEQVWLSTQRNLIRFLFMDKAMIILLLGEQTRETL